VVADGHRPGEADHRLIRRAGGDAAAVHDPSFGRPRRLSGATRRG
jgi:hypothetical protein